MSSLSGKVAAISGAARGIGDAIAARLIADGATVFSLDKQGPDEPRAGVTYIEADVTDPDSVAAAFARIDRDAGQIDILVNNAGIQRVGLVGKVSFADFSAVVATHLNGFFLCASRSRAAHGETRQGRRHRLASPRPRHSSGCRDAAPIARPRPAYWG